MRTNKYMGGREGLDIRTWLFDLDGTLYFDDKPALDAGAVIDRIRRSGGQILFVTNNSRHSPQEIGTKLEGMGLEAPVNDIVTATEYTGRYLREKYGRLAVSVVGSSAFATAHITAGHEVRSLDDERGVDAVVIGLDESFTYDKLERIVHAVNKGAKLIAANSDLYHPGRGGRKVPETGALATAAEAASGVAADYIGKPAPHLFLYALALRSAFPEQAAMVGDNYNTDILGGKGAGLFTVWLNKSGEPNHEGARQWPAADLIFSDMSNFYRYIGGTSDEV